MKKFSIVLCLVLAAALCGCGSSEPAATKETATATAAATGTGSPITKSTKQESVVGYWYYEEDGSQCMAFYEDGTMEGLSDGEVELEGKYKQDGNKITLTVDNENIEGTISGNAMKLVNPDDASDTLVLQRGEEPQISADIDEDEVDYDILEDTWYVDGVIGGDYIILDAAGNFWIYSDGDESGQGTYVWEDDEITLTDPDSETLSLTYIDEDTLYVSDLDINLYRESASSEDTDDTLVYEQVAEDGEWIEMTFVNNSTWTITGIYLYEDSSDMGYNHIDSIGTIEPGEETGIGVEKIEGISLSVIDENDEDWFFAMITLDAGATVTIDRNDDEPTISIEYSNGYVAEETGSIY